jgi:hypothetical protein
MRMVVILACVLMASGCATATRGTNDKLVFDTIPDRAHVRVEGWFRAGSDAAPPSLPLWVKECETPCFLAVERDARLQVVITKPGFQTENFAMEPRVAGATAVGSFALSVTSGLIDGATGALLDHCPNPVRFTLRAIGRRTASAPAYDPASACAAQVAPAVAATEPPPSDPPI